MIKVKKTAGSRVCQGDIIKKVEYTESVIEKNGVIELSKIRFPNIIVLTQDCDLEQDNRFRYREKKNQDKWLISILVAPLYNAEHVFNGEHLDRIDMKSQFIKKKGTEYKLILQNQRPRYHYIEFPSKIELVPSIIDFKHYFSVHVEYLRKMKKENFVCTVSPLFRELISQRFSNFLARIGLPGVNS